MILTFADALAALGPNAAFQVANGTRPPGNYLFNTFLPERMRPDYNVEAANMIVRATMAGLAAMDSPYPPGGAVELSTFLARTAKLAITNTITEGAMRELQALMRQQQLSGTLSNEFLQREALNFLNKVIIQAHLDRAEWLRGQALQNGQINWTYNNKELIVDYGIPAANFLTVRTDANGDAYGDTSSAFWTDVAEARRLLRYNLRAAVLNSTTMDEIVNNDANNIEILSQDLNVFRIRRYKTIGGNTVRDTDARYQMDFVIYDEEGEVLDTDAGDTFGQTKTVKFMDDGKILYVGQNTQNGYRVGQGSTDDPANDMELGYHHMAPTVEGGGNPGRWSRLYVPEGRPMHLTGEGAENSLPVITAPDKVVVAETELMP